MELQRITEELRDFTARLQPGLLADLGLIRALEWLGAEAGGTSGFKFVFDPGPVDRDARLDGDLELGLYRIAQEALSNCQRHAKAGTVWARLAEAQGYITLTIEDDGAGILGQDQPAPGQNLGLIGMRERAEQLGGHLEILARDPTGTIVTVTLPPPDSEFPQTDGGVSTP